MKPITLRAHFAGVHIQLDEQFDLQPNTQLIVTVLPLEPDSNEDEDWYLLARQGLEAAYGEDEPEYSDTLIKEWNPEYERG